MGFEQLFLLLLLVAVFGLFIWGRWRYDVVAFAALLVAVVAGVVPFADTFSGFGHPATVTVALVLVIGRGFQNAGAVDLITRRLTPDAAPTGVHIGLFSGVVGALSAVMNNVGALALMMPAALQSAARAKRPAALILMPLSFASILGGLVTLIGTPPNIIIAAFRTETAGAPFQMFDFTPVGGTIAIAGIVFVSVAGWRLIRLPERPRLSVRELFEIEDYVGEAIVDKESPMVGRTVGELAAAVDEHDAVLLGVVRRKRRIDRAGSKEQVKARDEVIIEAGPEAMKSLAATLKLTPRGAGKGKPNILDGGDVAFAEAVVLPGSRVVGRLAENLRLPQRHGAILAAVSRRGRPFRGRLRTFRFRTGDVLLLEGDAERLPEIIAALGCLPLAERGLALGRHHQLALAVAVFAAAIAAATVGVLSLPVALAVCAGIMVVVNIVPARELYDSIDWPVVVLLGALIPVGQALEATGTSQLIAGFMLDPFAGAPPVVMLIVVLVVTMTLSDVLNNAATAVVMAPIAVTIAGSLGVNADTFLMAVAIGASSAFLTPIGHQNNALIMGPGGYRFGDYWRLGLPLEVLIVAVAVPMLVRVWPL